MMLQIIEPFPSEPLWRNILYQARQRSDRIIIHDTTIGENITFPRLLTDIDLLRQKLVQQIPRTAISSGLIVQTRAFVALSTSPNYEFYVAALTVLALGGAIVPLRPEVPVEEVLPVLATCDVGIILAGEAQRSRCEEIKELGLTKGLKIDVVTLNIRDSLQNPILPAEKFTIDEQRCIPSEWPGLVIQTTGTTGGGKPRSVVHKRALFQQKIPVRPDDIVLIFESLDWISGTVSIMNRVLSGARGEILKCNPGPSVIWARLKQGGVTSITDHAWFWEQLAAYHRDHITTLPEAEKNQCKKAIQELRWAYIVGAPPGSWLLDYWQKTFQRPIQIGFVATELGTIALSTSASKPYIERSLGEPFFGCSAKLSNGESGELLVKTPNLFLRYVGDENATQLATDQEGFFKTGDFCHMEKGEYIFDGRIGVDILQFADQHISILALENKLLQLPMIHEIYGLRVPDPNGKDVDHLGVLVRYRTNLNVDMLHEELSDFLTSILPESFPAPDIRELQQDEEVPRTFNMKPFRVLATNRYFPSQK